METKNNNNHLLAKYMAKELWLRVTHLLQLFYYFFVFCLCFVWFAIFNFSFIWGAERYSYMFTFVGVLFYLLLNTLCYLYSGISCLHWSSKIIVVFFSPYTFLITFDYNKCSTTIFTLNSYLLLVSIEQFYILIIIVLIIKL